MIQSSNLTLQEVVKTPAISNDAMVEVEYTEFEKFCKSLIASVLDSIDYDYDEEVVKSLYEDFTEKTDIKVPLFVYVSSFSPEKHSFPEFKPETHEFKEFR